MLVIVSLQSSFLIRFFEDNNVIKSDKGIIISRLIKKAFTTFGISDKRLHRTFHRQASRMKRSGKMRTLQRLAFCNHNRYQRLFWKSTFSRFLLRMYTSSSETPPTFIIRTCFGCFPQRVDLPLWFYVSDVYYTRSYSLTFTASLKQRCNKRPEQLFQAL